MTDDFVFDAPGARFPKTRRSAVIELGSDDPATRARSFEIVARAYFRPVYTHIRLRFRRPPEEAEELTQAFFAEAFEKRFFATYDPKRAHFRTFLKLCLDRFVGKEARARRRLRRGAGIVLLSLDFQAAEAELARASGGAPAGAGALDVRSPEDVEACFDRAFARSVLTLAVDRLRAACDAKGKSKQFAMFEAVALEADQGARASYAELAQRHGVSVTDVTNYIAAMRRDFRRAALETLRELCATEDAWRDEARALFGIDP